MTGNEPFTVGDWTVSPALDRITQGERQVSVRPQVMDLLVYLARHGHNVVSTQELMENVWQGKVVTRASIYSSLNQLREALGDDFHDPKYIRTIPKRGYRMIAEVTFPEGATEDFTSGPVVRPLSKETPGAAQRSAKPVRPRSSKRSHAPHLLGALAALILILVLSNLEQPREPPAGTAAGPPPSVAVLPFQDMSPKGDQGWFCDGMAEEILNRLAQVPDLKVSGRLSSFAFRDSDEKLDDIARILGVNHILEGSVRRDGEQVRVTAQLLHAEDGFHVWSQTYDGQMSQVFDLQDDIADDIARAMMLELTTAHGSGSHAGTRPGTKRYEQYLQARNLMHQRTRDSLMAALAILQQVLESEPDFAAAHVAAAETYLHLDYFRYYAADGPDADALARPHIQRALEIDPNLAEAHILLGRTMDEPDRGKEQAAYRRAVELNPNLAMAHLWLGIGLANDSRVRSWQAQMPHIEKALELEPLSLDAANNMIQFLTWHPHRRAEAWDIINRVKRYYPENPLVLWNEAIQLTSEFRLAEAVPILEKVIFRDTDNVLAGIGLNSVWFALGEPERALESEIYQRHWRYVLDPYRERARRLMIEEAGRTSPLLEAYVFLMHRDWPRTIAALSAYTDDTSEMERDFASELAKRYSPALSLAVASREIGDLERYQTFIELEKRALDIKSENGHIRNDEYSTVKARLFALEGHHHESLYELERMVTSGRPSPRELMHPAYDPMREMAEFENLYVLQRDRVNRERVKLGLSPLSGADHSARFTFAR